MNPNPVIVVVAKRMKKSETAMRMLEEKNYDILRVSEYSHVDQRDRERISVIVVSDSFFGASEMSMFPNLKMITRSATGVDTVDIDAAKERSIVVTRVASINAKPTGDLALTYLLALTRNIVPTSYLLRHRLDIPWQDMRIPGRNIAGMRVGIIGLGHLGRHLARRLHSWGVKLVGWNRTFRPEVRKVMGECVMPLSHTIEYLMEESDAVVCCLAYEKGDGGNEKMISWEILSHMKPGSFFVNVGRGAVVDEDALADMMEEGRLAGLALDVYSEEPPFKLPFFSRLQMMASRGKNIILAPHMGDRTQENDEAVSIKVAENVIAVLEGRLQDAEIV
ncbi:MAG: hypothetical protein HY445_02085 [Candidatus Niyogibacteria bacterium]|nr:hypothetical protein [Candidatus Niyogibacteria bacterium]